MPAKAPCFRTNQIPGISEQKHIDFRKSRNSLIDFRQILEILKKKRYSHFDHDVVLFLSNSLALNSLQMAAVRLMVKEIRADR
jgi:hypothetical protein